MLCTEPRASPSTVSIVRFRRSASTACAASWQSRSCSQSSDSPRGYFDSFADVTWEQAQRCAAAAENYASVTRSGDPFIAQLLGLLGSLARIVLFRLTVDMYREQPNVLPRAEVFIRSMQVHAPDRRLPARAVLGVVRPRDDSAARASRPSAAGADAAARPCDLLRRAGRHGDAARLPAMPTRGKPPRRC